MAIPSNRLRARIFADFSANDAERVLDVAAIPESLPGAHQDAERIQASAVIPAGGDYGRFRGAGDLLHLDWGAMRW